MIARTSPNSEFQCLSGCPGSRQSRPSISRSRSTDSHARESTDHAAYLLHKEERLSRRTKPFAHPYRDRALPLARTITPDNEDQAAERNKELYAPWTKENPSRQRQKPLTRPPERRRRTWSPRERNTRGQLILHNDEAHNICLTDLEDKEMIPFPRGCDDQFDEPFMPGSCPINHARCLTWLRSVPTYTGTVAFRQEG